MKDKFNSLLLCVGAQKAGTSWLSRVLTESEHIEFSDRKEVHYFDTRAGLNEQLPQRLLRLTAATFGLSVPEYLQRVKGGEKAALKSIRKVLDDGWYRQQFTGERAYCADFTPEYALLADKDFRHIKSLAASVKVLFIMRDPVARTLSAFRYFHQNRDIDITTLGNQKIMRTLKGQLYSRRSNYLTTLQTLQRSFADKDVLYLFYENMMADKPGTIARICDFLQIPEPSVPDRVMRMKVNASRSTEFDPEIYAFLEETYRDQKAAIREAFADTPQTWFAQGSPSTAS